MTGPPIPDSDAVPSPERRDLDRTHLDHDREPIGKGGEARVYEVHLTDDAPPDRIALKEPLAPKTLGVSVTERFLNKAKTWEKVDTLERDKRRWRNSDHVVGVIDLGEELPWIAIEFMDGGTLDDRLDRRQNGLSLDEALWIGECVCRGLEVAHSRGIAHLDLKPGNVLFRQTAEGYWDYPKVGDWGLARVLTEEAGAMDALTVEYAAPEQFDPVAYGDPDELTDVYQIGAVVYAALTGRAPYEGPQRLVRDSILDEGLPAPPSAHRDDIPPEIDVAVLEALRTEKTDRYNGVNTLRDTLKAIRTGDRLPTIVVSRLRRSDRYDASFDNTTTLNTSVGSESPEVGSQTEDAEQDRKETTSGYGSSILSVDGWTMFGSGPSRSARSFTVGPSSNVSER